MPTNQEIIKECETCNFSECTIRDLETNRGLCPKYNVWITFINTDSNY
jgi:hypothetical protein